MVWIASSIVAYCFLLAATLYSLGGRGGGDSVEIEKASMLYLFFPFQISEKE